jgi:hypothetical protein
MLLRNPLRPKYHWKGTVIEHAGKGDSRNQDISASPARFARFISCYSLGLRCKHEKAVSAWWSPSISNAHLDKLKLADKVVEHCRTFDSIDSSWPSRTLDFRGVRSSNGPARHGSSKWNSQALLASKAWHDILTLMLFHMSWLQTDQ